MKVKLVEVGGAYRTNCYIVADDAGEAAVIDPGFDAKYIESEIKALGVNVKLILLTHGHRDHIGALKAIKKSTGATVCIGRGDEYRLDSAADVLLDGGESVCAGELSFSCIATPGHTQGGMCYVCKGYLFSGDTLFCDDIGRTDLEGGDFPLLVASLKKLARLPGDYTVLPGHEEPTTLAHERSCNRYMR